MKISVVVLTVLISVTVYSQNNSYQEYNKLIYPSNKYSILNEFYSFKSFKIELIHACPKDHSSYDSNTFACRIWLKVKSGQTVLDKLYYNDSPALGGCSGIFVSKQLRNDYFILSKFGDYSGQIIIIDTTGKIKTFPGGSYYFSNDTNFLFSTYDSDISGLTIFDFAKNNSIYTSKIENGYLEKLYYYNKKYFFTITKEGTDTPVVDMLIFDPASAKLNRTNIDTSLIKKAIYVKGYNKYTYGPCNCGRTK